MCKIKNLLDEELMYTSMESDDYADELEYYRHQVEDGKVKAVTGKAFKGTEKVTVDIKAKLGVPVSEVVKIDYESLK